MYIICHLTLVMFLHYLILHKKTEKLLSSVSGPENSRLCV